MLSSVQAEIDKRNILHYGTNPLNIPIEDLKDNIYGMLINWEFAVEQTVNEKYSMSGIVDTLVFCSLSYSNYVSMVFRALFHSSQDIY